MSTETQKYSDEMEREPNHSAFEEFSRDERRPAVLLLGALVIAALFFALGIMIGRWTTGAGTSPAVPANQRREAAPALTATPGLSPTPAPSSSRQIAPPTRNP